MKKPCVHWPNNPPIASYERTHLGPLSETAQNALLGAAFCKGKLCSGNKYQPQCVLDQDPSACLVLTYPRLPISTRMVWAASGSVSTAAWLVGSAV